MRRCLNCGITTGIKDNHNFCYACGGTQFEAATNNKNQNLAKRVADLEKKTVALENKLQEQQKATSITDKYSEVEKNMIAHIAKTISLSAQKQFS